MRYKIFVIFHDQLNLGYYQESLKNNLVFVNVSKSNKNSYPELTVINLYEIPDFISLGKWYTESEVIYNINRSALINDLDYVGFVHYDIDFTNITNEYIVEQIKHYDLINLQCYSLKQDYDQKILMDENFPNRLKGEGKNCYETIFKDYNKFYNSDYKLSDYIETGKINLCACYILNVNKFKNMMLFINYIIESRKLDLYDKKHKYRIQGGLLERYYAVWFLLDKLHCKDLNLDHYFLETKRQEPVLHKIKNKAKPVIIKLLTSLNI